MWTTRHQRRDCRLQAQANLVEDEQEGYETFGEQGALNEFSNLDIFMISALSTVQFPFGDRKALVSINSNCSRHMTGFYDLLDVKSCDINVHRALSRVLKAVQRTLEYYSRGNYSLRMRFLFQD